ncbi:hypothetical protein Tco_0589646, partial [Tanacetum coccineum]
MKKISQTATMKKKGQ